MCQIPGYTSIAEFAREHELAYMTTSLSISDLHEQGHHLLIKEISSADQKGILCPSVELIFRATNIFPLEQTKVVILGQDPYYTEDKASGLAFGYNKKYKGPTNSSLKNIIEEVYQDTGLVVKDRSLESWAEQGVLLLNTRLTTTTEGPLKHKGLGWEEVVGNFLKSIQQLDPHVYLLWGREAASYRKYVDESKHLVLETSHPCRFSYRRGFSGCKHFSKANQFLAENGKDTIKWGE